jgi:hypothetical protein
MSSVFGAVSFASTIILALIIITENKILVANKDFVNRDLIFVILV